MRSWGFLPLCERPYTNGLGRRNFIATKMIFRSLRFTGGRLYKTSALHLLNNLVQGLVQSQQGIDTHHEALGQLIAGLFSGGRKPLDLHQLDSRECRMHSDIADTIDEGFIDFH